MIRLLRLNKWQMWHHHIFKICSHTLHTISLSRQKSEPMTYNAWCAEHLVLIRWWPTNASSINLFHIKTRTRTSSYHHVTCSLKTTLFLVAGTALKVCWFVWLRMGHCVTNTLSYTPAIDESCLHYLLPAKHDAAVTSKLRHNRNYELIMLRTEKFWKSFIPYGIEGYKYINCSNCYR